MNSFFRFLQFLVSIAILMLNVPGHASVITDTYDPKSDHLITTYNSPFTYTHDLRPQGLPGLTVESVNLAIYLYDISDVLHAFSEKVTFKFDKVDTRTKTDVSLFGKDYTFNLSTNLLADGLLDVSLSAGCNARVLGFCVDPQDFVFARSVLTVTVTDPAGNVPEPTSLAIFALGLLILGQTVRKQA